MNIVMAKLAMHLSWDGYRTAASGTNTVERLTKWFYDATVRRALA